MPHLNRSGHTSGKAAETTQGTARKSCIDISDKGQPTWILFSSSRRRERRRKSVMTVLNSACWLSTLLRTARSSSVRLYSIFSSWSLALWLSTTFAWSSSSLMNKWLDEDLVLFSLFPQINKRNCLFVCLSVCSQPLWLQAPAAWWGFDAVFLRLIREIVFLFVCTQFGVKLQQPVEQVKIWCNFYIYFFRLIICCFVFVLFVLNQSGLKLQQPGKQVKIWCCFLRLIRKLVGCFVSFVLNHFGLKFRQPGERMRVCCCFLR